MTAREQARRLRDAYDLRRALTASDWRLARAARLLHTATSTLQKRLARLPELAAERQERLREAGVSGGRPRAASAPSGITTPSPSP